jgi:hypothetical protein
MKTMVHPRHVTKTIRPTRTWVEPLAQLLVNITAVYIANQISIEIWRSMTGH